MKRSTFVIYIVSLLAFSLAAVTKAPANPVSLQLSTTTITFPDSNPDQVPIIPAAQNPVTVTVRAEGTTTSWILEVIATDDLRSGADTIPIDAISWTANGAYFQSGDLSKSSMQAVGAGPKGNFTGVLSFQLANSWFYDPGIYTTTITYTLVAP
ncbi:MAG TPA: hypothetical protein VFJ58_18750 [Armatimonadota bacterium]|nr:hypothetical protein [Armatimonadota bacterium]